MIVDARLILPLSFPVSLHQSQSGIHSRIHAFARVTASFGQMKQRCYGQGEFIETVGA